MNLKRLLTKDSLLPNLKAETKKAVIEELLSLSDLLEASKNMKSLDTMGSELIGNLF